MVCTNSRTSGLQKKTEHRRRHTMICTILYVGMLVTTEYFLIKQDLSTRQIKERKEDFLCQADL